MINYYHTGSIRGNFDRLVVSKLDQSGYEPDFLLFLYCRKNVIMSKFGSNLENKEINKDSFKQGKFQNSGVRA